MNTFDVFGSGLLNGAGHLTILITGAEQPPVVHDEDSGASVVLEPACLSNSGLAAAITYGRGPRGSIPVWAGELPHGNGDEARLRLEVDGLERRATVRWS